MELWQNIHMKEIIIEFIAKLNLVQRIFLFLILCNIILGPKILDDFGFINVLTYDGEVIWWRFFSFEWNFLWWAINLILIIGMLIFKKGNQ